MSDLERQNIPLIGCLMQDIATPVDAAQQFSLAIWVMKTAMVMDSVKGRAKPLFYQRPECVRMREERKIPEKTQIWIGRYSAGGLGAIGTDLVVAKPHNPKAGLGCATTVIVGHLAVQVLAIHLDPADDVEDIVDIAPKAGPWDDLLLPIWPIGSRAIMWPPAVTFTNGGERSIAKLADRWRIGNAVHPRANK